MVASLGCSFDASSGDSNPLGSSAGNTSEPTTDTDAESTGEDSVGTGSAEGETSFGGSTSVGSDEACVDACVAPVPGGWQGPFYVADAANPIDCPNGYNAIDVGYSGLAAPPAECGCSCSETPSTCEVSVELSAEGCFPLVAVTVEPGNSCSGLTTAGFDVHARASMNGSPTGCTSNIQQTIAPAEWTTASTFCAAPARGGDCGDERCTALPPEGVATRLCISKDGEAACPGGGYDHRTVLHREIDDQRSCQGCNCTGPAACTGQAFAHDDGDCNDSGQALDIGACVDINVTGSYGISASVDGGSCTSTQASAAGEAVPTNAVTICCAS